MKRIKELKTTKTIIFVIIGLIPVIAYGAPNITGISGATTNGSVVTISGSGFSTKATAPPLISSFDSAVSADNWNAGSIGSNWYQQYAGEQWLENTTNVRVPGSYVMEMDAMGDYSVIGYSHMSPDSTMYVSWWQYFDYDEFHQVTGRGNNAKFMRMWPDHNGGAGPVFSNQAEATDGTFRKSYAQVEHAPSCPNWVLEYTATNAVVSSPDSFIVNFGDANIIHTMRQWVHWEAYFTFNTPGARQDKAIIIKDGQTVARSTAIALTEVGDANDARMVRIGVVTGDRTVSQMEYVDHIYYDNSFAHVFITDSPTNTFPDMANVQHTEVQVAQSWSDTSVSITVNKGTFPNGQAYLYVMDSSGAVNSKGYAITLGGVDETAPTLTEVTPVPTPTHDSTPNYTFNSNEPGTITYAGDCSSSTTNAINGNNTITLNTLPDGTYGNCTITVTDSSNNTSTPLSINTFTLDTSTAPSIRADVDQNAIVNAIDALLTLRNSLGLDMTNTHWQASGTTGDVNCDGISNFTDSRLILRSSLGLDMGGTGWCDN